MPPPIATLCPGPRCDEPRSSWPSRTESIRVRSPPASNVTRRRSGGPASGIGGMAWRPCSPMGGRATRVARSRFPRCNGPKSWNWPAWSRSPRGCTSPTGPARIWPVRRWPTRSSPDQPGHGSPHLARCRSATPSDPVLEDGSAGCPVQRAGGASPLVLRECGSARRPGHLGGVRR